MEPKNEEAVSSIEFGNIICNSEQCIKQNGPTSGPDHCDNSFLMTQRDMGPFGQGELRFNWCWWWEGSSGFVVGDRAGKGVGWEPQIGSDPY